MKGWCKIVKTEEYDFLVVCSEEALLITFMTETETFNAEYNPNKNTTTRELFDNDEKLRDNCPGLVDEMKLHYEN